MYTLVSIHSGKVKTINSELLYINEVKDNNLLIFKTKKEAINHIKKYLCWALAPIKISKQVTKVHGQVQYYNFDINNIL